MCVSVSPLINGMKFELLLFKTVHCIFFSNRTDTEKQPTQKGTYEKQLQEGFTQENEQVSIGMYVCDSF